MQHLEQPNVVWAILADQVVEVEEHLHQDQAEQVINHLFLHHKELQVVVVNFHTQLIIEQEVAVVRHKQVNQVEVQVTQQEEMEEMVLII